MSAPYSPEETAALRRASDWRAPFVTNGQLIERGFDAARRFYAMHPELLPDPELLPGGAKVDPA